MPEIFTIPNVVIAEVGDWATVNGDGTMTADDLAAAVAASQDPGFRAAPKGKPGHYDPRFDGTPGIGRYINFRLSPNGMQLIADHAGLLAWQKTLVLTGFMNRSVEAWRGLESSATRRKYGFVITAVALLGVEWPAVSTLEDLSEWATDSGPESIRELVAASAVRPGSDDDKHTTGGITVASPQTQTEPVRASANLDQIRRDFIEWADEQGKYSWWIREVWLDPNEIIVDSDDGNLWRVPFSVADGAVDFSEATPVTVSYIDAAPTNDAQPVAARRPGFAQVYANRSESRPALTNDDGKDETMDTKTIIAAYGLPADTTDEQAQAAHAAALDAAKAALDADDNNGDTDNAGEVPAAPVATEATTEAAPVAASSKLVLPEGTKLVDAAQFDSAMAYIEQAKQREAEEVKASRVKMVDNAVKAGKVAPADRAKYLQIVEDSPEAGAQILASLSPTVPVTARGTTPSDDAAGDDSYPAGWSVARQSVEMRKD
jgi:hypothetical protein